MAKWSLSNVLRAPSIVDDEVSIALSQLPRVMCWFGRDTPASIRRNCTCKQANRCEQMEIIMHAVPDLGAIAPIRQSSLV